MLVHTKALGHHIFMSINTSTDYVHNIEGQMPPSSLHPPLGIFEPGLHDVITNRYNTVRQTSAKPNAVIAAVMRVGLVVQNNPQTCFPRVACVHDIVTSKRPARKNCRQKKN
jgi:hypothetical protein